jgi:hypothetical protein
VWDEARGRARRGSEREQEVRRCASGEKRGNHTGEEHVGQHRTHDNELVARGGGGGGEGGEGGEAQQRTARGGAHYRRQH